MGIFDIFKKKPKSSAAFKYYDNAPDGTPSQYYQNGGDIFKHPTVVQAVNCISREMSKLRPVHSFKSKTDADPIEWVLNNPNDLMTLPDFITKTVNLLFANDNVFIIPQYAGEHNWRNLIALFPVAAREVDFFENAGEYFVTIKISSERSESFKYSDVIHIRRNYGPSFFMGGNREGQPNLDSLRKLLDDETRILTAIEKATESASVFGGIIKSNSYLSSDELLKQVRELEKNLNRSKCGFLALDSKADFTPISRAGGNELSEKILELVNTRIFAWFGVPPEVALGHATADVHASFFQTTIEPLIASFSAAFTKCLFSQREGDGYAHRIDFVYDKIELMSVEQKINYIKTLSDIGAVTPNEIRALVGYESVDLEEMDKPTMSKNFGSVDAVAGDKNNGDDGQN